MDPNSSEALPPPPPDHNFKSYVIASFVISAAIFISYFLHSLLRFLNRRFPSPSAASVPSAPSLGLVESLPSFPFRSVAGSITSRDCAICLTRFRPHHTLRLLPICCHAFHDDCIGAWLEWSPTCPLCRSAAFPSESDMGEALPRSAPPGSFHVEMWSARRLGWSGVQPESGSNPGDQSPWASSSTSSSTRN